jgi:hypothetical protein
MSHQLQGDPGEITWHEGNVWVPDANTPNSENGAEQEPVSGINLLGKISLQIGKAQEELQRTNERVGQLARAIERNTPIATGSVASGYVAAGVSLVLDLGSPDVGTFWELSSMAIGGTEVNVTAAGKWGLYVSSVPSVAGAGLSNIVDVGVVASSAMPYSATYSTGQIIVHDQEHIFAVIFAGTAGQQYVVNAQYRVYNTIASQGQVTYAV